MLAALLILLLAPTPAEAREAARRVLARGDYQTELRSAPAAPEVEPGRPRTRQERTPDWESSGPDRPDVFGSLATVLFWVIVGVLVAVLLFWLGSQIGMRRAQKRRPAAPAPAAPSAAPALRIVNPESLAGEGRYAEAVHMLLLTIFAKLNTPLAEAWTSREVVERAGLESVRRFALEEIVSAVEITRFGGQEATRQLYRNCVARADEVLVGPGK